MSKYWIIGICVSGVVAASTRAQEQLRVHATADVLSQHVWRGQQLNDGWVFQPGVSVTYGRLTAGWWASLGLTDDRGRQYEVERSDVFATWTEPVEGLADWYYSVGFRAYDFPRDGTETSEITGRLWWDVQLEPSIWCDYDTDDAEGVYLAVGIQDTLETTTDFGLGQPLAADFAVRLGWASRDYNAAYWGQAKAQFNDLTATVSIPLDIGGVELRPTATYVALVGSDIRDSGRYSNDSSYLIVGLSSVWPLQ